MASDRPTTAAPHADLRVSRGPAGMTRVVLTGEFDLAMHGRLRAALDSIVNRGIGDVCIDAADLRFCDAATVGLLVNAHAQLRSQGRQVTIEGSSRRVRRILRLAEAGWLVDQGDDA